MNLHHLAERPRQPLLDDAFLQRLSLEMGEGAEQLDRDGAFPHDNLARLRQYGLLGLACEARAGGGGADLAQLRRVVGAVAKGEPSTALVLCMQYLFHRRLADNANWPEALKRRVIREAVEEGNKIFHLTCSLLPARAATGAGAARAPDPGRARSRHALPSLGASGRRRWPGRVGLLEEVVGTDPMHDTDDLTQDAIKNRRRPRAGPSAAAPGTRPRTRRTGSAAPAR